MNGIYIHVPFCLKKCRYCDFYSVTDTGLISDYVNALTCEIERVALMEPAENRKADTLYFGGGTPSVLSLNHVEQILDTVFRFYSMDPCSEITLEVNPGTVSNEMIRGYKTLGINRLSIGVQSFQDRHLEFLGRIHNGDAAMALLETSAREGFDNVGLDLMYGLPGQDTSDWLQDLTTALGFKPAHISCYMLSYEEGTPLYKAMVNGHVNPLAENKSARLFEKTMEFLDKKNYVHYEISNFARSRNTQSRHNKKYWDFQAYRGFGPSAHSFIPSENRRCWNVRDLVAYNSRISKGQLPVEDHEILTESQQITEALFLGLRKREGIFLQTFNTRFNMDFLTTFKIPVQTLCEQDLIRISDERIFLSQKGVLFADHITSVFVNHDRD